MNKRSTILFYLFLLPLVSFAQKAIVIKNIAVVDVKAGKIIQNMFVVVQGNKITSLSSKATLPENAITIDGKGKYLIPGLWDMHAHALSENRYEYTFPLLIANGVTGIREIGNYLTMEQVNQVRHEVETGKRLGPRIGALTYRILDGEGTDTNSRAKVTTPEQARAIVQLYKEKGADFIKPYNLLSREVYLAMVEEARKQNISLQGHTPLSMTPVEVSDLGQKSIEHNFGVLLYCSKNEAPLRERTLAQPNLWGRFEVEAAKSYDKEKALRLYAKFVQNCTWSCPTVFGFYPLTFASDSVLMQDSSLAYVPGFVRERWHQTFLQRTKNVPDPADRKGRHDMIMVMIGDIFKAGVRMLAGTDFPEPYIVPGFSLHQELEFLVRAGLPPIDALRTATCNPAIFLGREKEWGAVAVGKVADLVLLTANPLENISNTKKIEAVIVNGRLLQRKDLDALLNQVKQLAVK